MPLELLTMGRVGVDMHPLLADVGPTHGSYDLLATPESAGRGHSGFRILTLKPREAHALSTGDSEFPVLPLTDSSTVTTGRSAFEITGRTSVFASATDCAHLPRASEAPVSSANGWTFALPPRPYRAELTLRPVRAQGERARRVAPHRGRLRAGRQPCLPGSTVNPLDEAINVINTTAYGDGTALSTVSGEPARRFRTRPTVVVTTCRPGPAFGLPAPT